MTEAKSIAQEVERHAKAMESLVSALKAKILALPDNPNVSRIRSGCFIAQFKDMGRRPAPQRLDSDRKKMDESCWTPEYHDFKKQYELLVAAIEQASPDRAVTIVQEAVEKGSMVVRVGSRYSMKLHPTVIEHLKTLLGETLIV